MTQFYDARGNLYGVISPQALRESGIDLPASAAQCALSRQAWSCAAIALCCDWPDGGRPAGSKSHRSDGLLIGPFRSAPPFDLLIVNTDGTLAERSGNGLTIFSQALLEQGLMPEQGALLRVHHDQQAASSPVPVSVKPADVAGVQGFWLELGQPGFGPQAVGASGVEPVRLNNVEVSCVQPLAQLDPAWAQSQFVRIGNPHCVTLVQDEAVLPSNEQMRQSSLGDNLTAIAYAMPVAPVSHARRASTCSGPCMPANNASLRGCSSAVRARRHPPAPAPVLWPVRRGGRAGCRRGRCR